MSYVKYVNGKRCEDWSDELPNEYMVDPTIKTMRNTEGHQDTKRKEVDMVRQSVSTVNKGQSPITQDAKVKFEVPAYEIAFFNKQNF